MSAGFTPLNAYGRRLILRRSEANPYSSRCPLHLRRICGTCAHFDGHLRQDAPAACTAFSVTVTPTENAWACERWTRKSAKGAS